MYLPLARGLEEDGPLCIYRGAAVLGNRPVLLFATALALGVPTTANAQSTCGDALAQLQSYAGQVNQITYYEYNQGIAMRCYGNPMCANYMLLQLQQWYAYQANSVNNWYMQLARQCAEPSARQPLPRGDVEEGIDEDAIEELEVDDEDRTVVLRIPDNPRGFQPRGR